MDECVFGSKSLKYLGYIINENGISTDNEYIKGIENFETPKCYKNVKRILGLCSFYSRFIKNYSIIAAPLYNLKNKKFK